MTGGIAFSEAAPEIFRAIRGLDALVQGSGLGKTLVERAA